MDVYKTHGAFSWSELTTPDPKAALAFYGQLFSWQHEDMDMGTGAYHVIKVGDRSVGGVMGMPPDAPAGMPSMWGCYVTVDDIDATARRCVALGGQVVLAPTDIPAVGRMAVLKDPQGALVSAITYAMD